MTETPDPHREYLETRDRPDPEGPPAKAPTLVKPADQVRKDVAAYCLHRAEFAPTPADGMRWIEQREWLVNTPTCGCGQPQTLGTVHRADGPCWVPEPKPGAETLDEELDRLATRNRELSTENANTAALLFEARRALADRDERIVNLEAALGKAQFRAARLTHDGPVDPDGRTIAGLLSDLAVVTREREHARGRADAAILEAQQHKGDLSRSIGRVAEVITERDAALERVSQLEANIDQRRHTETTLKRVILERDQAETHRAEAVAENDRMGDLVREVRRRLDRAGQERDQHRGAAHTMAAENARFVDRINAVALQRDALETRVAAAEGDVDRLAVQVYDLTAERDLYEQRVRAIVGDVKQRDTEIARRRESYRSANGRALEAERRLAAVRAAVTEDDAPPVPGPTTTTVDAEYRPSDEADQ